MNKDIQKKNNLVIFGLKTAVLAVFGLSGCGAILQPRPLPANQSCLTMTPEADFLLSDTDVNNSVVNGGDLQRLTTLFKRAERGEELTLGVIGGSITQGAGASGLPTIYAERVFSWFRCEFPNATFKTVNAGIGGTDSHYGSQRLDRDLLPFKPDFVITEWANNDGAQGPAGVIRDYSDVVDRVLALPNRPALLMLFTTDYYRYTNEDLQKPVGFSRNLPMISMRSAVQTRELSLGILGGYRTADPVHPNDFGHEILAKLVIDFLSKAK